MTEEIITPNTITKYSFNRGMHTMNSRLAHWQPLSILHNSKGFNIYSNEETGIYEAINIALAKNNRAPISLKTPFIILSHRSLTENGELFEKILNSYVFTSKEKTDKILAYIRDVECQGEKDSGYFRKQTELVPKPTPLNINESTELEYMKGRNFSKQIKTITIENLL